MPPWIANPRFASVGICRRTGFAETLRAQFAASNPDKADDESTAVLLMCSLPQTGPEVLDFAERCWLKFRQWSLHRLPRWKKAIPPQSIETWTRFVRTFLPNIYIVINSHIKKTGWSCDTPCFDGDVLCNILSESYRFRVDASSVFTLVVDDSERYLHKIEFLKLMPPH